MRYHCLVTGLLLAVSAGQAVSADAKAGAMVFKKCAACHSATEPTNRVGPSLMGLVGRPVATAEGYSYSAAMKAFGEGGKIWDVALLTEYIASPRVLVKGTKMAFGGVKKPDDVASLIAYLKDPAAAK